jgi:hypothetical protein
MPSSPSPTPVPSYRSPLPQCCSPLNAEDFTLSAYDSTIKCAGFQEPGSAGRGPLSRTPTAACTEPVFSATYLPMGGTRVVEHGITVARLRACPPGVLPHRAAPWRLSDLTLGQPCEVQWRLETKHPFGMWLGTVHALLADRAILLFSQYPSSSPWRRVEVPVAKGGKEGAVAEQELGFSLLGGIRGLSATEEEQWRQQKLLLRQLAASAAACEVGEAEGEVAGGDAAHPEQQQEQQQEEEEQQQQVQQMIEVVE